MMENYTESEHLILAAEVDALMQRLGRWTDDAPDWEPAGICRMIVEQLSRRAESFRVRLDAPLVVATLGGTGTGKSSLINALLGGQVVDSSLTRPTTTKPIVIARHGLIPEMLGIDPKEVELVHSDSPILSNLVLIDCPDPDTSLDVDDRPAGEQTSNLARLRDILPHCDVVLVTATQQKYRSGCVREELLRFAAGAHFVFVQTFADCSEDVRDDWLATLEPLFAEGLKPLGETARFFLVDTQRALEDAVAGLKPSGEFDRLVGLLRDELSGSAAARIRRANFLDLVAQSLEQCRDKIDQNLPAVEKLREATDKERDELVTELCDRLRKELPAGLREWEHRLVGETASRWGVSPMSLVLRAYHGVGSWVFGAMMMRARSPAQMALIGAVEAGRHIRRKRRGDKTEKLPQETLLSCWSDNRLSESTYALKGYVYEARISEDVLDRDTVLAESQAAGESIVASVSENLQEMIRRLAEKKSGWFTRFFYEFLLMVVIGAILFRLGKNYFYDSWFRGDESALFGTDFYISSAFWLLLWCLILTWSLTRGLRRGLKKSIHKEAQRWQGGPTDGLFLSLADQCRAVGQFDEKLTTIQKEVERLRTDL